MFIAERPPANLIYAYSRHLSVAGRHLLRSQPELQRIKIINQITMKKLILIYLLSSSINLLLGQTIHGRVMGLDQMGLETSLPGATLSWLGTTIGTMADSNGYFSLEVPQNGEAVLVTSFVGFLADTLHLVKGQSELTILLKSDVVLNDVVIEGEQSATSISTLGTVNKIVLNEKELLKAACCNLSESFETNVTVDAEYSDAVTGARTIRLLGLDGVYAQISANHVPVVRGLASGFGLSYIPGSWIESIQITKGPGSVEEGYEGISGSVNAQLQAPGPQEVDRLLINLYGNLNGRMEANLLTATDVGDMWSTGLLFHGMKNTLAIDHNSDGFLDMPLGETYSIMNNWVFNNSKRIESKLGVKWTIQNSQGGQPAPDFNLSEPDTSLGYVTSMEVQRLEGYWKLGMKADRPGTYLTTLISGILHQQDAFYGLSDYAGDEQFARISIGGNTYIGSTNHLVKAGISFQYNHFDEAFRQYDLSRTEKVPGVYGEYIFKVKEKVNVMAGYRADYHNLYGWFQSPRLHVRYSPNFKTTCRISAGKAYRVANVLAENAALLISSRDLFIADSLQPEEAWNAGFTITRNFRVFNRNAQLSADIYRTYFIEQVVVDRDTDPLAVYIDNLDGRSMTDVAQVEWTMEPLRYFEVRTAYRYTYAQSTFNGVALEMPLIYRHRAMLNLAYNWKAAGWMADATLQYYGSSRLPDLSDNHMAHDLGARSEDYIQVLAQVTKKLGRLDVYAGVENATNFTQHNPIIAADDPYGPYFDASIIYAPIMNRRFYAGLRLSIQ